MKNIIAIKENERCCINCEHYRQHERINQGITVSGNRGKLKGIIPDDRRESK